MQENKRNKETSLFKKPQGFRTIRIRLTAEAIEWLGRTTKDDDGNTIGNHTLFYDLLSRMRLSPGRGDSFRITSLIPALRGQGQEDLCELKPCLIYRMSSRTAKATQ